MSKPNKSTLIKSGFSDMKLPRPFRPREMPATSPNGADAPMAESPTSSLNSGESISPSESVIPRPGQMVNPPQDHAVNGSRGEPTTESPDDRITPRPGRPMHLSPRSDIIQAEGPDLSNRRAPTMLKDHTIEAKKQFCAVPQVIFCKEGLFENTFDLAVYLYLVSRSYGFGRNTCDMGIAEIANFTKLAKNSVRKSLDRLIQAKWIRIIQSYESCIVTRKWRIYSPYELGLTDEPTFYKKSEQQVSQDTDSPPDPITPQPVQSMNPSGASGEPVTGSRRDTYKNSSQKQIQKHPLSCGNKKLAQYFSELKPVRKRESEWQAFQELKNDYPESDIVSCLDWLTQHGSANGGSCHSPMAFLALAMGEILAKVKAQSANATRRAEAAARAQEALQQQTEQETTEALEHEVRLRAFRNYFAGQDESKLIAEIARQCGFPITTGQLGRSFAISHWWRGLSEEERRIATQEKIGTDGDSKIV